MLWIYVDGYGEPEHVIRFVQRCADTFDLSGLWGFTWSTTCSKPRVDAFSGGAILTDLAKRTVIDRVNCDDWLMRRLTSGQEPNTYATTTDPAAEDTP